MATFDNTRVYLNTRKPKYGEPTTIFRTPVPQNNESFYFNQESIQVIVYYGITGGTVAFKESEMASIHLTNKRLVLLSQNSSIASTDDTHFDTCELQLSDFQSLKSDPMLRRRLRLNIKTIRNETIRIDIKFKSKKDANRRESLMEYIKMATSAILSSRICNAYQQQQSWIQQDTLPSYFEATHTNNIVAAAAAPPAYS